MSADTMVERLRPALKLLPVECHDTPDYAEATGPQFQAMTMVPEAFLALNKLPELFDYIERLEAEKRMLVEQCANWLRNNITQISETNIEGVCAAMVAEVSAQERATEAERPAEQAGTSPLTGS